MGEGKMAKLEVPSEPGLLNLSKVAIVGAQDRGEGCESGNGLSLGEQDETGQETGVIFHGEELCTIMVPFCPIVEHSKMVL
jgi:hypothetical protein